jgi:4-hydroxy-tetrahydrodipicolinate synthase
MTAEVDLRGLWVPVITPFTDDGAVDLHSLSRIGHEILQAGAAGLVALGTTGEPATLDDSEQQAVITACADVCSRHGRGLMVGAGTNSTAGTVRSVMALEDVPGVTAALVVVPYYSRPSEEGVVRHYRTVAEASPVPVVAYNIPVRTGRGLGTEALLEIAGLHNVAGLKQAVGCLDRDTLVVLADQPSGFSVLAGDDAFVAPSILMGAAGAISAAAHVATDPFASMVTAALAGDTATARSLASMLLPVVDAGFAEPSPAVWKAALHAQGRINSPQVRPPLTDASPEATDRLLATLP